VTPPPDLFTRLLGPLHDTGIPYMVTGGLAAIIYGEPRLTNDVDLIVQLRAVDSARLVAAFPEPAYYLPPTETIAEEASRPSDGHFNILHIETALRADVYCAGDDALMAWGLGRARLLPLGSGGIRVAPIEYVVVQKLRWYRDSSSDRHLRDIAAMRRISGELIQQPDLDHWVERLGLRREWERASGPV
jgi:hypothetical protein